MNKITTVLVALAALATTALAQKPTVVFGPFTFEGGTATSRETAMKTMRELAQKLEYPVVPQDKADQTYKSLEPAVAFRKGVPVQDDLVRYSRAVGADRVVYGAIKWHTRSIWVGAGPKTISTATVDVGVLDVPTGKVIFSRRGVEGRSDEKENDIKVVAAVLVTPLVTVASGGPATPREQRAVQIAIGKAYNQWATEQLKAKS